MQECKKVICFCKIVEKHFEKENSEEEEEEKEKEYEKKSWAYLKSENRILGHGFLVRLSCLSKTE